jgi:hypothetical protein
MLKTLAMFEAQKMELQKYGKIEDLQAEGPIRRPERGGVNGSLCPNCNSKSHTRTPIAKTT